MSPTEAAKRSTRDRLATRIFIGLVAALSVTAGLVGLKLDGPPSGQDQWIALGVLSIVSVLGIIRREIVIQSANVYLSLSSILLLASAVILGPFGAAIVGLASALFPGIRTRPSVHIFNAAMYSLIGSLTGLTYRFVSGDVPLIELDTPYRLLTGAALPLLVADVVALLSNALLVGLVVRFASGLPIRAQVLSLLGSSGPAYLAYGVIGFLFAVLWVPAGLGPFSAILILAPLLVARWAFVQYADEEQAHNRTLAALVTALERKDPRSIGHGARVAQLCDWTAQSLQLSAAERDAVRTAGMLHDLGRIAVPSRVLRARDALTDHEILQLADHPQIAVEMLRGIDFMQGSLEAINHHHERFDGLGYPEGLAGQQIPLGARIIAAADAFDALTTQRPYRQALTAQAAMATLRERAPDHLDPTVVDALIRAVSRQQWEALEFDADDPRAQPSVLDHDDLEASDAMASRSDLRRRIRERHSGLARSERLRT